MRRTWWAATALCLITGCSNVLAGDPTGRSAGSSPVDPGEIPPDALVWMVDGAGGDVKPEDWFPETPKIAIYGDGTAYLLATDDVLTTGQVDPEDLHELLSAAAGSDLFDGVDFGDAQVMDGSSTIVSTYYDGELHEASAYSLGFGDDTVSSAEQQLRAELTDLIETAESMVSGIEPYDDPDRVEIYNVAPYDTSAEAPGWTGPELSAILTQGNGTCGEATGVIADAAFDAFAANPEQYFTVDGEVRRIQVTILLPHQEACDD